MAIKRVELAKEPGDKLKESRAVPAPPSGARQRPIFSRGSSRDCKIPDDVAPCEIVSFCQGPSFARK